MFENYEKKMKPALLVLLLFSIFFVISIIGAGIYYALEPSYTFLESLFHVQALVTTVGDSVFVATRTGSKRICLVIALTPVSLLGPDSRPSTRRTASPFPDDPRGKWRAKAQSARVSRPPSHPPRSPARAGARPAGSGRRLPNPAEPNSQLGRFENARVRADPRDQAPRRLVCGPVTGITDPPERSAETLDREGFSPRRSHPTVGSIASLRPSALVSPPWRSVASEASAASVRRFATRRFDRAGHAAYPSDRPPRAA